MTKMRTASAVDGRGRSVGLETPRPEPFFREPQALLACRGLYGQRFGRRKAFPGRARGNFSACTCCAATQAYCPFRPGFA